MVVRGTLSFVFLFLSGMAGAQVLVDPANTAKVDQAFAAHNGRERLNCTISSFAPFLDFAFRFESGYTIDCPVRIFKGKPATMMALIRVTPEGQMPVLFKEQFRIPGMSDKMRDKTDLRKVNARIGGSGAFALGEGRYAVEVMVHDNQNRFCRKEWEIKAARNREEQKANVSLPPWTAAALNTSLWKDVFQPAENGVRLTVLLDAAPMNPRSQALRAWDQAFLLDSVTSLVRRIPCQSVRLVAFNVDQQREIFRQDQLDRSGLAKLWQVLRQLELGTISYHVLKRPEGGVDLLTNLSHQEITAENQSDAVVFVGPALMSAEKISRLAEASTKGKTPKFFYLQYFPAWRRGREFPDTLQHLTDQYKGTVLKIHSPGELAEALHKVREELRIKQAAELGSGEETASTK